MCFGLLRKTLLCGVQVVKDQLDIEGRYILQDGKSTVAALLELFDQYKLKRDSLSREDGDEVVVPGYSASLVDAFERGLPCDIVVYRNGYDRLEHQAWECNRSLAEIMVHCFKTGPG